VPGFGISVFIWFMAVSNSVSSSLLSFVQEAVLES
jgi:hypothetical protein